MMQRKYRVLDGDDRVHITFAENAQITENGSLMFFSRGLCFDQFESNQWKSIMNCESEKMSDNLKDSREDKKAKLIRWEKENPDLL